MSALGLREGMVDTCGATIITISTNFRKITGRKLPHTLPCMSTKSSMWLDWSVSNNCNFVRRTSFVTYDDPSLEKSGLRDYYSFVNNPYIDQKVKDRVKIVFDEQARKEQQTLRLHPHPQASLRSSRDCSGELQTLLSLECLEDNTWMVKTPRGHVHAKKVVIATNAYTRALLP
ncbi:hypothetical protein KL928_005435, partial [Ogataea angusta]